MEEDAKRYGAEFLGTLLLVFFGVGSSIAGRVEGGVVVVALAFGFIMLVLAYTLGPVSGSHLNPAVTLGALVAGRITVADAVAYWTAQFAGGLVGALPLWVLARFGKVTDQTGALGTNGYGAHINLGGTVLLEIILTFLFVFVVLVVTSRTENAGFAGLAMGIALGACNLVAVPLDGASVNPARSLGPAAFQGGIALSQVWVFIIFPLIGGVLAALVLPLAIGEGWSFRAEVEAPPPGEPD